MNNIIKGFLGLNLILILISYFIKTDISTIISVFLFILIIAEIVIEQKVKHLGAINIPIPLGVVTVISSFFILSNLKPVISEKLDPVFWSLFILEIGSQFYTIRKFKQAVNFKPILLKTYNYLQSIVFTLLLVYDFKDYAFWIILCVGVLANTDMLLILKWLPFYKSDVKSSIQAYKVYKDFNKIYNRK